MANLKRLAVRTDGIAIVHVPVSHEELTSRRQDYPLLTPEAFSKKYRDVLFRPTTVTYKGEDFNIQVNHCSDPYCRWFGMPQERFEAVKNKPYRYKLGGSDKHQNRGIVCNSDPLRPGSIRNGHITKPLSNWSVTEEIARLATNDHVAVIQPEYDFHREVCPNEGLTPFENKHAFYRRGKSTGNSQKWQCKECRKITNVLPKQRQAFGFNQKRNDIMPLFARCLLNRVAVKRTCEILEIGSKTYYSKLEWLYTQCLKFLERHEQKPFQVNDFERVWVDTDQLNYYLNNIKKRGHGGGRYEDSEEPVFQTFVLVSADVFSKYVFRADVAYDWQVSLDDIQLDTVTFKEDHMNDFGRKNARLRFPFAPQPPTPSEANQQTQWDYVNAWHDFELRRKYTDGMHVDTTYTAIAHYWLIKQMVNAKKWRFISDEDGSLMTALYRVFKDEVLDGDALHFLCKTDRAKTLEDASKECNEGRNALVRWGRAMGERLPISELAKAKLAADLQTHQFYEVVTTASGSYKTWARNPLEHPLPTVDKGYYTVDCTTDVSRYTPEHLANLLFHVNNHATNAFMQQIRRRLSGLERPLVTARGDGKSYIYSNFNPKYAQYAITILRTYYNFCLPIRERNGDKATPAQRLGIADRKFNLKDIIYFK